MPAIGTLAHSAATYVIKTPQRLADWYHSLSRSYRTFVWCWAALHVVVGVGFWWITPSAIFASESTEPSNQGTCVARRRVGFGHLCERELTIGCDGFATAEIADGAEAVRDMSKPSFLFCSVFVEADGLSHRIRLAPAYQHHDRAKLCVHPSVAQVDETHGHIDHIRSASPRVRYIHHTCRVRLWPVARLVDCFDGGVVGCDDLVFVSRF